MQKLDTSVKEVMSDGDMLVKAVDIKWDVDDGSELADLPRNAMMIIKKEYSETISPAEIISDTLSDEIGYCHKGFNIEVLHAVGFDPSEVDMDKPIVNMRLR